MSDKYEIIKPCPFCGNDYIRVEKDIRTTGNNFTAYAYCQCDMCQAVGPVFHDVAEHKDDGVEKSVLSGAVYLWNKRLGDVSCDVVQIINTKVKLLRIGNRHIVVATDNNSFSIGLNIEYGVTKKTSNVSCGRLCEWNNMPWDKYELYVGADVLVDVNKCTKLHKERLSKDSNFEGYSTLSSIDFTTGKCVVDDEYVVEIDSLCAISMHTGEMEELCGELNA